MSDNPTPADGTPTDVPPRPADCIVRRDKGGATHFAVEIGPDGNVTRWSRVDATATPVTLFEAERVAVHYAGLLNGGTISFIGADGKAVRAKVEGTLPPEVPAVSGGIVSLPNGMAYSVDAEAALAKAKGDADKSKADAEAALAIADKQAKEIEALRKLVDPKKLEAFDKTAA